MVEYSSTMRFFFLNPKAIIAILALLWCAKILQSLPSDWVTFKDSEDRGDRAIQVFAWVFTLIIAIGTGSYFFSFLSFSFNEIQDWMRF